MKIVIIQDYLRWGGTEKQAVLLADYFQGEGNDVSVLTFRPGGELAERLKNLGVVHAALQKRDLGYSFFAPGLLRKVGQDAPDVILCMGRMANCYAGFIQRKYHDVSVVGSVRTGKELSLIYRWSLGRVRAILVNSRWWQNQLIKSGIEAGKVEVIYNALALPETAYTDPEKRTKVREQFGASSATCVYLNVAEFRRGKRHRTLIRVFSQLDVRRDWQLWIVGDGKESSRCRLLARRLGVEKRMRFFGYQEEVGDFYAAADVAVTTSMEDSLPNFLIEAQAAGLPVIASDTRGVKEAFKPGETGFLIPPHDSGAFLKAVIELHDDSNLRRKFGSRARPFVKENFSRKVQVDKVLRFLKAAATDCAKSPKPFLSGRVFRISGWRRAIFWPLCQLIRLYLSTLRFEIVEEEKEWLSDRNEAMLLVGWHNRFLLFTEILRRYRRPGRLSCLISPSRMAAWVDAFCKAMGYRTIRGSSSRRSIAATRELLSNFKSGDDIGITPDGPSGPLYEFKRGAMFIARISDAPILMISAGSKSAWRLRTWDRHLLPLPFSVVHLRCSRQPRFSRHTTNSETELSQFLRMQLMDITED